MRKLFYFGLIGLALFEIAKVYFIMPFPGSQRINSLDLAYFLHLYANYFRVAFALLILIGTMAVVNTQKLVVPVVVSVLTLVVVYMFNFQMMADKMFLEPEELVFKPQSSNQLGDTSLVIGVAYQDEVKAYPIQFIAYHHKVQDTIGGKPMLITYCNVCRTGRVFEPMVNGTPEKFRLVGMDHFNAMLEDATTGSWWRQANGEAVTGPLKGTFLPEVPCEQLTVGKLFDLYPSALVMQADQTALDKYDSLAKFERGKSEGKLTRTDTLSWQDKSWVIGVVSGNMSRAYDWNGLKKERVIHDQIDGKSILIVLSKDEQSFAAFERPDSIQFDLKGDSLISAWASYDFSGRSLGDGMDKLKKVKAYQEFWHSWRTFHPETTKYPLTQ